MKNYVITGSVGHISKPVIEGLVKSGKNVNVVTSSNERQAEIEHLGAKALVGSVEDGSFVLNAFKGADAVYTMTPPNWQTSDWRAFQNVVARNYAQAISANKVKHVVNLSSIGADVGNGVGPVDGDYDFEQMLNRIPGLHIKHLRPAYFFSNLLAQIPMIKQAGFMGSNFGEGEKLFLVHSKDVAATALDELTRLDFTGNSVKYIIGDERSGKEIADVLGNAINKPLNWVVFSDEQEKAGLLDAGLPETHAQGYTQMGKSIRQGIMQRDARRTQFTFAPTKLEEFAKEFTTAFNA
jgi:uncharacterized protein YbjT (DUF2867 family)